MDDITRPRWRDVIATQIMNEMDGNYLADEDVIDDPEED